MILKHKKLLAVTSLLTLLPIPIGLLLWNRFPETMAIHFGLTGQADGYADPSYAVFVPPILMLAVHWLCILATALDKGNKHRNGKMQAIVLWTIPIVSILSSCGIYALALGWEFSPVAWTMIPMGILFTVIGNYLPKTRMNSTIGIKVIWAYSSEENWNATHRFAGKAWVIAGILMMLCGFLPNGWAVGILMVLIAVSCVLPMAYSRWFYKKELAAGKPVKAALSKTGKKISKWSVLLLVVFTAFILFVLFAGSIDFEFREDHLYMDSGMYTAHILPYEDIDTVEYREGNVPGLRVGGYGSFRLLMGWFENEEFGTYIRYTYYKPEACVIVTTESRTLVLSGATAGETQTLYQTLLDKTVP